MNPKQTCGNCKHAREFDACGWAPCRKMENATKKERAKFPYPKGFNAVGFDDEGCAKFEAREE